MSSADEPTSLNWLNVTALYAALLLGLGGLLYWGNYRNAAWLALLGTGGAFTAYARILEHRGASQVASRWNGAAALVYGIFFLWAG
ncbi:MAG: hypothetical protein ABEL51_01305, partial [Salinibacter sp.]